MATPCPADPPAPVVSLRVRAPACVDANQELQYCICVENCSAAAAHHVTVRNPMPANAQFVRANPAPKSGPPVLEWYLGTLGPCQCREITLVLRPTGGDVTNCARVQFEHGQCVTTKVGRPAAPPPVTPAPITPAPQPQVSLRLRKFGSTQAVLYDNLTFKLEVTNVGSVPAPGVVLTDVLPDGLEHASGEGSLSWSLGTMEPGQCRCIEYQAIAKKSGRLCNQANVVSGNHRQQAEFCINVGEAKLQLEKRGPDHRIVGNVTYQLTVINPGSAQITNVVITDPVPAGLKFISATNGGRLVNNQVTWLLGPLGSRERRTVQVTLQAQQAGEVINRATVTADRGLSAQAEAKTVFEGATGLTMEVTEQDDPVELGRATRYTVRVINQGTAPATKVGIVATIPEQMAITGAKGASKHRIEGQRVIFEPLPTLQARSEAAFEISVQPRQAGIVLFGVELTADQLPAGPVRRQESTNIYDPNGNGRPPP